MPDPQERSPQVDITDSLWELARTYQGAASGALEALSAALDAAESLRGSDSLTDRRIRAVRIREAHDVALAGANALIDLAHEALAKLVPGG